MAAPPCRTAAVLPSRLYLLSVKTLGSVCPGALTTPSAPEALTEKSVDSGEITSGERRAVRCWRVEGLRATEEEQRSTSSVPGHSAAGRHTGPVRTGETQPTLLIDLIDVSTTS